MGGCGCTLTSSMCVSRGKQLLMCFQDTSVEDGRGGSRVAAVVLFPECLRVRVGIRRVQFGIGYRHHLLPVLPEQWCGLLCVLLFV